MHIDSDNMVWFALSNKVCLLCAKMCIIDSIKFKLFFQKNVFVDEVIWTPVFCLEMCYYILIDCTAC